MRPAFYCARDDAATAGIAVCTTRPRARASATPSARNAVSASDCTVSRSRPDASGANGPISPSMTRPVNAAAARAEILVGQPALRHGGRDPCGEFGRERTAKGHARGVKFGIDRLGDGGENEPPVAQCPRRESQDRRRKRR